MSIDYREDRIVLPETWHSASEIVIRDSRLYYRLGEARPLRDADGRYHRDPRGRIALEAFLGLPIDQMFDRLEAARVPTADLDVPSDPGRSREAFQELISFVETFGPLAFDWSRIHPVVNAEADRLAEENWRLTLAAAGFRAEGRPPSAGRAVWRVMFPEPGQPFYPHVEKVTTYPDLPWEERVRLGDPRVHHDDIGTRSAGSLAWARKDLAAAVRLADALSGRDRFVLRDAIRGFPRLPVFDVRALPPESSLGFDWRSANRGMAASDGWFKPFEVHERHVDWVALGRMVLAEHMSFKLATTAVGVGLRGEAPAIGWRIGSLLDVIYLQLLEHVRQHPDFGIGSCAACGAPILRVRRSQRWHSGCAPAGRQRESRAARKLRAQAGGMA